MKYLWLVLLVGCSSIPPNKEYVEGCVDGTLAVVTRLLHTQVDESSLKEWCLDIEANRALNNSIDKAKGRSEK